MRKLELKDICSYLPYELKCKYRDEDTIWTINPLAIETDYENCVLQLFHLVETDGECKPYLYSMDWLTKEITHKGETFVPIVELAKILLSEMIINRYNGSSVFLIHPISRTQYLFSYDKEHNRFLYDNNSFPNYHIVFDKLSEWHFDFRGLIDADLALPVTEEFNHYKTINQ